MAVHGGKKLSAELQKLSKKARGRNLDEATRLGADLLVEQAKINVHVKTGRLRRSIFRKKNSQASTDQNSNYLISYNAGRGRGDPEGAYYGAIEEYRHPYLFPAAFSLQDRVPDVVSKRLARKMGLK